VGTALAVFPKGVPRNQELIEILIASGQSFTKGDSMYWVMVAIMAGVGLWYVAIRRRRKADAAKSA
jgi:hypothetical protein